MDKKGLGFPSSMGWTKEEEVQVIYGGYKASICKLAEDIIENIDFDDLKTVDRNIEAMCIQISSLREFLNTLIKENKDGTKN